MHGGVCGCAEVHGQVCSSTWRCAEVHRGMHRGVRGTEVHGGVYGGARRWTEGCVEVDQ